MVYVKAAFVLCTTQHVGNVTSMYNTYKTCAQFETKKEMLKINMFNLTDIF